MSIRLLLVDDSPFIRKAIMKMLEKETDIDIVGEAKNGKECVEKVIQLKPDVVTLDVEMPVMNGLEALKIIMEKEPTPVVMFSSLTEDGAKITLEALNLGAIDYLPKDIGSSSFRVFDKKKELVDKIKMAYQSRHKVKKRRIAPSLNVISIIKPPVRKIDVSGKKKLKYNLLTIGTSTGGPPALEKVIPRLPKDFPIPILIVQHMPPLFTKSLAERLNSLSQITVKEAESGDYVQPGYAYIAPGSFQMTIVKRDKALYIRTSKEPANLLHRPSVDVLFSSAARYYQKDLLAVVLTGMGHDGRDGGRIIKKQNGTVIAQDEDTCVVFGMPGSIVKENLADHIVPIDKVANKIIELVYP